MRSGPDRVPDVRSLGLDVHPDPVVVNLTLLEDGIPSELLQVGVHPSVVDCGTSVSRLVNKAALVSHRMARLTRMELHSECRGNLVPIILSLDGLATVDLSSRVLAVIAPSPGPGLDTGLYAHHPSDIIRVAGLYLRQGKKRLTVGRKVETDVVLVRGEPSDDLLVPIHPPRTSASCPFSLDLPTRARFDSLGDIRKHVAPPDPLVQDLPLPRAPLKDPIIVQPAFGEILPDLLRVGEIPRNGSWDGLPRRKGRVGSEVEDLLGLEVEGVVLDVAYGTRSVPTLVAEL